MHEIVDSLPDVTGSASSADPWSSVWEWLLTASIATLFARGIMLLVQNQRQDGNKALLFATGLVAFLLAFFCIAILLERIDK